MTFSASADKRLFNIHTLENARHRLWAHEATDKPSGSLPGLHNRGQFVRQGEGRSKNSESAYHRLKVRLLREPWAPGQLLQIGVLAAELGTSATPVREALVRLATERLIVYRPKKGFLVKILTEEELRELYFVSRMHLEAALCCWQERASTGSNTPLDAKQPIPTQGGRATDLTDATEELMLRIAAESGIDEITAMVSNINDRLHRVRIAEQSVLLDHVVQQVHGIDVWYAAADHEKLKDAIRCYHELRLQRVRSICKELLSMAFTSTSSP